MWKCFKVGSFGCGVQFSTVCHDNDPTKIWNVVGVLESGVRVCCNYETREIKHFSPRSFGWRYFIF